MKLRSLLVSALALGLPAAATLSAATGPVKDKALELSKDHAESIVWVTLISKVTIAPDGDSPPGVRLNMGGDRDRKSEVTGTIIDASGLIVTSLGALDNSSLMDGREVDTKAGKIRIKVTSEVKECKVILADGTEVPADLVLKDADLDLAFVRLRADSPEAKGLVFKPVNFEDSAVAALLDDAICLGRLDANLNREPTALVSEVSAVMRKPRKFYRIYSDAVGCPVFNTAGKVLGLTTLRTPQSSDEGNMKSTPVVLPATDVVKIAAQAKTAQVPVKAPAKEEKPAAKEEAKPAEAGK